MKKITVLILLALALLAGCSAITAVHQGLGEPVVKAAVAALLGEHPDWAPEVLRVADDIVRATAGGVVTTVESVGPAILHYAAVDNLPPDTALIVRALASAAAESIRAELVDKGVENPDAVLVAVGELAAWVRSAAVAATLTAGASPT